MEDEGKVTPAVGEELICLNANVAVNPSYLVYAPGDGNVYLNNFGDDLTDHRMQWTAASWPPLVRD